MKNLSKVLQWLVGRQEGRTGCPGMDPVLPVAGEQHSGEQSPQKAESVSKQ